MSDNYFKKEDMRVTKTHKALINAMLSLLGHRNFRKITVNDLCAEALVSRASFYVHFADKYDLLRFWMDIIKKDFESHIRQYTDEQMVTKINDYMSHNYKILVNLLDGANAEILELLFNLMSPRLLNNLSSIEKENQLMSEHHMILSHFYSGGMMSLLLWQIKNKFPVEKKLMSNYLYQMLKNITTWDLEQK